jgi:hypothetical protein
MARVAPLGNSNRRTHGLSHTRLDNIYKAMISRCYKPNNRRYKNYGGRGIKVCDEWKNDKTSFFKWALANGYSDTLTIDRINNNGNYEPANCRWATTKEQQNNRSNNHLITHNGETKTIAQWAEFYGKNYKTLYSKISQGVTLDDIC